MSDYFFYDLNKKMADLANKQQLAETAQSTPAKPAPSALRTQLNERDLGKHNNATTGFAALAKKTGGGEKGAKIAGAQLAKMRAKGQVEESTCSKCDCNPCRCDSMDESALQAAFGKKKYGDQGMKALQKAGRDHASDSTMNKIRNRYDKYDESMTDEGNAFSGAVVKAKKDGIQPGEKISVGGKQYKLKETDATPQDVESYKDPVKAANAPQRKASAPVPPPKKTVPPKPKMYPPQAIDEPVSEADDSQDPAKPARLAAYQLSRKLRNPEYDDRLKKIEDDYNKSRGAMSLAQAMGKQDPKENARRNLDLELRYKRELEVLIDFYQSRGSATPAVQEGGVPMSPKQKKFAALAKPFDKITFADKIVGAKKEVDEMLGDVAADAMKKAIGKGQSSHQRGQEQDDEFVGNHFAKARNSRRVDAEDEWARSKGRTPHADMDESFLDDEPTSRKSSTGGRIDTSQPGRTIHRAVKGNYSGAAHDAGADDEPTGAVGRRKVGAGMGKKIGAKINRGTSKLMTDEGNMPEDMIEPQDSGEYDREGDMAKDTIKTVVRHAQALEKILGDDDNLPEWVQSKLAKIENMMTAVDDYMQNQKSGDMPVDEESTNKRDSRAERAGRKVAKDIEYDEKKKDGIHGQRRGSEDSRAERAGKKVTKDIEYDEKKNKKKKEVDKTSGSVATGGAAPKSRGGHSYGKGIYDSLNRQLENMISESMNINMSMNNDEHGGPRRSLTVTATDEDAVMLAGLLKMAGMGQDDDHIYAMTSDDSGTDAIHDMDHDHGDEPCADCGMTDCGCDDTMDEDRWGAEQPPKLPYDMTVTAPGGVDVKKSGSDWVYKSNEPGGRITATIPASASNKMFPNTNVDETYGDTDATQNEPDYPTDEVGTDNAGMYSGGIDGPKQGQTTVPVISGQKDRMGYEGDHELRRMMEIAGLR